MVAPRTAIAAAARRAAPASSRSHEAEGTQQWCVASITASGERSLPTARRPASTAASGTAPEPAKGSATAPPTAIWAVEPLKTPLGILCMENH